MNHNHTKNLVLSAMLLAAALLLPFLTGQIQNYGQLFCPMHLPILLCGFLCGQYWGLAAGLAAAPLRFLLFGIPKMPTCLIMSAELAVYGFLAGLLYRIFPKRMGFLYLSLFISMIGGRLVSGLLNWFVRYDLAKEMLLPTFVETVTGTWIGILIQILLVPTLVSATGRSGFLGKGEWR